MNNYLRHIKDPAHSKKHNRGKDISKRVLHAIGTGPHGKDIPGNVGFSNEISRNKSRRQDGGGIGRYYQR
jgi:hypothetical protein